MKKGLAVFLIGLSFFAGFFVNKTIAKENQGLTKSQTEKLINRKISQDEWKKMALCQILGRLVNSSLSFHLKINT